MTAPTYPSAGLDRYYGRSVWFLGEDGDMLVEGHGRRALAALSAHLRYYYGRRQTDITPSSSLREGHAVFVRECGCTREDHDAGHPRPVEEFPGDPQLYGEVVDGKVLTDCDCDNSGLPPCADEWAWVAEPVQSGGLPVLWVRP